MTFNSFNDYETRTILLIIYIRKFHHFSSALSKVAMTVTLFIENILLGQQTMPLVHKQQVPAVSVKATCYVL